MGALSYIPELPDDQKQQAVTDLDWFADQVELVQTEMDIADIDRLQGAQGGSAGARPKIMIGFNQVENTCVLDYGQPLGAGFEGGWSRHLVPMIRGRLALKKEPMRLWR